MRNSQINDRIDKLESIIHDLVETVASLRSDHGLIQLNHTAQHLNVSFKDYQEGIKNNVAKLNLMINELKGVVSMSRAALDEGRKFTELLELPNLLRAFSEEYKDFEIKIREMNKMNYKTTKVCDKLEGLVQNWATIDNHGSSGNGIQ